MRLRFGVREKTYVVVFRDNLKCLVYVERMSVRRLTKILDESGEERRK